MKHAIYKNIHDTLDLDFYQWKNRMKETEAEHFKSIAVMLDLMQILHKVDACQLQTRVEPPTYEDLSVTLLESSVIPTELLNCGPSEQPHTHRTQIY